LRRFARDNAIEQLVRQQQSLDVRPNLRQQTFRAVLCRLAKEDSPKPQPAADRFLNDAQALNRAIALFRALGARKCPPELLDQSVVATFDAAQSLAAAGRGF
jgi:hypothetical protein